MNPSSFGSVPTPPQVVKPGSSFVVKTCCECWHETDAVLSLFGREVCPDCYRQAEEEHDQRQAQEWEDLSFGMNEQMSSLKSVLVGMGF